MKKYIHVNQMVIRHNVKYGKNLPVCRVQFGRNGKSKYCQSVRFRGGVPELLPNFENPLACGAKVWIETEGDVELIGEVPYSVIKKAMGKTKSLHELKNEMISVARGKRKPSPLPKNKVTI